MKRVQAVHLLARTSHHPPMPDENLELFRLHRAEQSKYVYFILAAAAGGIALAVRMTADATLHWWARARR